MSEQDRRRWAFLEDWPPVVHPGWLPPAEDAPALADLREAHLRILAAAKEASAASVALAKRRETELEAVRAAEEHALLHGEAAKTAKVTVTDADLAEARTKAEAARDALQTFVKQTISTICEREPEVMAALEEARQAAAAKRAEAQALLAEAEHLEESPKRMTLWMDRVTGRSHLGQYEYALMPVPPAPEPLDLEAALGGGTFTEVVNA